MNETLELEAIADHCASLRVIDARAGIEIVPVDLEQGRIARDAWLRFGKGRHRAALNYGDCFAYARARASAQALLFQGEDFQHGDVTIVH